MSVNIFHKSTGNLTQIAGNALIGGGGTAAENQVVFSKKSEFPTVGFSNKIYIDIETSKSYIYKDGYVLVGDGFNTTDWETIT